MSEGEQKKSVQDAVAAMIEFGLVETYCIAEDGEFTYRLTEKGVELNKAIDSGALDGLETEDEMDIAMRKLLNIIGLSEEGVKDEGE